MSRSTSSARAAAARRNGARSRGPKTAAGKARAAHNALKHGLTARQVTLIGDEDAAAFAALEGTALAPADAFQMDLARRSAPTTAVGAGSQARGSSRPAGGRAVPTASKGRSSGISSPTPVTAPTPAAPLPRPRSPLAWSGTAMGRAPSRR